MASQRLDVVGIGNALVDVLSYESDDFVAKQSAEHTAASGKQQLPGSRFQECTEREESHSRPG